MVLAISLAFVFVVGASVGSFLNVVVARLPLEKSLLWPASQCGSCLRPILWYDNIPIISYLWLRGRCRSCGQSYSMRYLLVEFGTALSFVALFWVEVVMNIHQWPGRRFSFVAPEIFPGSWWLGYAWHAVLFSFLLAASLCDLESREIPLSLTLTGTLVGVIGSAFFPWPWPHTVGLVVPPDFLVVDFRDPSIPLNHGIYAWPFWGPLPDGFPEGSWQTGLATGIVGALAGTFLLRAIGFLFGAGLGKEVLGLGDADLMMMAGSFLGWQLVVVAFFLSVIPALFVGILQLAIRKDNSLPFGPSLSAGVIATCLAWHTLGDYVRPVFFWSMVLFWLVIACALLLLVMSFLLRMLRVMRGGE